MRRIHGGLWAGMLVAVMLASAGSARALCAPIAIDDAVAAQSCLDGATQFFADAASGVQNGFSSFEDLLPYHMTFYYV